MEGFWTVCCWNRRAGRDRLKGPLMSRLIRYSLGLAILLAAGGCAPKVPGAREETLLKPELREAPAGKTPLGLYVDKASSLRTAYWRFQDDSYRANLGQDLVSQLGAGLAERGFSVVMLDGDPETEVYPGPLAGAVALRVLPAKTETDPLVIVFQAGVKIYNADRRKMADLDLRSRIEKPAAKNPGKPLREIWNQCLQEIDGKFLGAWDLFTAPGSAAQGKLASAWNLPYDIRFKPGDPNQLENTAAMDSLNTLILKMREHKNVGLDIEVHVFPEPLPPPPPAKGKGKTGAAPAPAALSPETLAVGRAGALRRYVSEWGIGADRISVNVRVKEVPLVPEAQPGSARVNNRIDFVLKR